MCQEGGSMCLHHALCMITPNGQLADVYYVSYILYLNNYIMSYFQHIPQLMCNNDTIAYNYMVYLTVPICRMPSIQKYLQFRY